QPLGLSLDDLARQVRQAFYGEEAQRIQRGRDDVRVMVRYPESDRRSLADLENLRIRTPDGGEVPFYTVARAERGRGYANIKRRDRQRVINVTADVNDNLGNANEIMRDLHENFMPGLLADHPGVRYGVEGVQREQAESMAALILNYGFALILIYALLAVPLRSYGQPLIIMAVIPFGLVGAIGGHLLLGMDLSMMSVFGVVALSGVIVNDSLVLVHHITQRREAGVEIMAAVRQAGEARFRPILLTSLTTFAGLTPLLLEGSLSAQFLIPMATSLAFGVLFGTVISLFLVPSAYTILEDVKTLLGMKPPQAPPRADVAPLRPVSGAAR
ncbi:MAG: efflux RND transporter permease subunit, partial [Myxococcota bacterium]